MRGGAGPSSSRLPRLPHGAALRLREAVAALAPRSPPPARLLRRYATMWWSLRCGRGRAEGSSRREEMIERCDGSPELGWSVSRTGGFEKAGHLPIRVALLRPATTRSLLRAEGAAALTATARRARPCSPSCSRKAFADEDLTNRAGRANAHARVALILSKVANARGGHRAGAGGRPALGVDSTQLWIEAQQLQGARARGRRPEQLAQSGAERAESDSWPPPFPSTGSGGPPLAVDEAGRASPRARG